MLAFKWELLNAVAKKVSSRARQQYTFIKNYIKLGPSELEEKIRVSEKTQRGEERDREGRTERGKAKQRETERNREGKKTGTNSRGSVPAD